MSNSDNKNLEKIYNQTVKKVTEDFESLNFNTAISQMMIFINAVYKENVFPYEYAEGFIKLLNPICPHMTEELWHEVLNKTEELSYSSWPVFDSSKLEEDTYELVVQVNGKIRGKVSVSKGTSEEELKGIALNIDNVKNFIGSSEIRKIIVIKDKIVNIVI